MEESCFIEIMAHLSVIEQILKEESKITKAKFNDALKFYREEVKNQLNNNILNYKEK